MLLSRSNYISNYELAQKCGGLVAIGSACSEINDNINEDYRINHGVERIDCKHTREGFFYRAIRLGERAEEGETTDLQVESTQVICDSVQGANEGSILLAESSPSMGKGESSAHNLKIEANRNKSAADSPAPPYGSGLRPKKWDDWGHVIREEEQGGMF